MLDPKLNVKLHEEIYGAVTKIITARYPRIKGAHCASIAYGIINFISEREAAAPSQPQQEAVPAEPSEQDKLLKLLVSQHASSIRRMFCDGRPVGAELIAAIIPQMEGNNHE